MRLTNNSPSRDRRADRKPRATRLGLPSEALEALAADIQAQIPSGRFGEADEIAHAAVFLAADESRFFAGAELVADGGMSQLEPRGRSRRAVPKSGAASRPQPRRRRPDHAARLARSHSGGVDAVDERVGLGDLFAIIPWVVG